MSSRAFGVVIGLIAALSASGALAQSQGASRRQTLVALSQVLGQSHALRQACLGPEDQRWRDHMIKTLAVEGADKALSAQMRTAFNRGFATEQAAHPDCNAASDAAMARLARRGQGLAEDLKSPMVPAVQSQ